MNLHIYNALRKSSTYQSYATSFFVFFAVLAFSVPAFAKQRLTITGSSTVAPVIADIARAFEKKHGEFRIDVQTGGSSRGIGDVRNKIADIGMVSRALKSKEMDLRPHTFAKDGLSVIIHNNNPIHSLSQANIKKIYLGAITNWKQLGGNDAKIVVVNKAEGRSTLELFLKFFNLKNSAIKASIIIGDNEQGIKTVSKNENAIAYVSVGTAEYNTKIGVPIKAMPYAGVPASVSNIKTGSYPLLRDLNLITKGIVPTAAQQFINYVKSADAEKIIREHYFVATE